MRMTVARVGCVVKVCTCHDDHAWTRPGSYASGCSSCGCHRAEEAAPEPTRCHECGEITATWVLVYLSDFDRVPCCLACCQVMGWLPEGVLSPAPSLAHGRNR